MFNVGLFTQDCETENSFMFSAQIKYRKSSFKYSAEKLSYKKQSLTQVRFDQQEQNKLKEYFITKKDGTENIDFKNVFSLFYYCTYVLLFALI
jgi:hypothetical protein